MKTITAMSILLLAVLSGCASPPPGELILTEEDMRLKRRPADDCPPMVTHRVERVTYSK